MNVQEIIDSIAKTEEKTDLADALRKLKNKNCPAFWQDSFFVRMTKFQGKIW